MDPAVWDSRLGDSWMAPSHARSLMTEQEPTSPNGADAFPPDDPNRRKYARVLLKLGGEMFGGGQVGLDPDGVAQVARQIAEVSRTGLQVAVVIGGGNFFRGPQLQHFGSARPSSDYMG